MKTSLKFLMLFLAAILISCGGKEEKKEDQITLSGSKKEVKKEATETESSSDEVPASERITLDNKGVGQIKDIPLDAAIAVDSCIRLELPWPASGEHDQERSDASKSNHEKAL